MKTVSQFVATGVRRSDLKIRDAHHPRDHTRIRHQKERAAEKLRLNFSGEDGVRPVSLNGSFKLLEPLVSQPKNRSHQQAALAWRLEKSDLSHFLDCSQDVEVQLLFGALNETALQFCGTRSA